jgi:hypothetical protein
VNSPIIKPPTKRAFYFPVSADGAAEQKKPTVSKKAGKSPQSKDEATKAVKAAKAVKPVKAAKTVKAKSEKPASRSNAKPAKKAAAPKRDKVVRDSFTMPKSDYRKIAELKERCLEAGLHIKKSEILRAGLLALVAKQPKQLVAAVKKLEAVKTGRPPKA